jgi:hypothetical protein
MELYHVFGGKYLKDTILLEINVDLVTKYTFLHVNPVHIAEGKVWGK